MRGTLQICQRVLDHFREAIESDIEQLNDGGRDRSFQRVASILHHVQPILAHTLPRRQVDATVRAAVASTKVAVFLAPGWPCTRAGLFARAGSKSLRRACFLLTCARSTAPRAVPRCRCAWRRCSARWCCGSSASRRSTSS